MTSELQDVNYENETSKKTKDKKKFSSLSEEDYNDIFKSVIESSPSSYNLNSAESAVLQNSPGIKSTPKNLTFKENKNPTKKKIVPKFNAPVKENVLKNISNTNQAKTKKFIPPITDSFKGIKPITKTSKQKSESSKVEGSSIKTPQVLPKTVTQEKENPKEVGNKNTAKKKRGDPMLLTTYKEADSTECTPDENTTTLNAKKSSTDREKNVVEKSTFNKILEDLRHESIHSNRLEEEEEEIDHLEPEENDKICNYELSQTSDGSILINENPLTQLSQPSPELNARQRLEWLRKRRDVGVWVQCCKPHCSKWRYMDHIKDPLDIPEYWVCQMNSDSRFNSCEKPERGPRLSEQVDLINNKFTAGSVVWGHVDGFPWWPAIVDDDPDTEVYYWLNGFSDIPTHYHVVFFDDQEVTRAWLTPNNMHPFTGKEKEKKFNVKYFRGINYSSRLTAAKDQAKLAFVLNLRERLEQYGFIARFNGPIGEKKTFKGKNQRKVSSDSESDTTDEFDDYNKSSKRQKFKKIKLHKISNSKKENLSKTNTNFQRKSVESKEMKHNKKTTTFHSSNIMKNVDKELKSNERKLHCNKNNQKSTAQTSQLCSKADETIIPETESTEFLSNVDAEKNNSSHCNSMFVFKKASDESILIENREHNDVAPRDSEDIDPFKENEIMNESISTNCESNTDHDRENVSCSNLVTIGTDVPRSNKTQNHDSKNSTGDSNIMTGEADTSDNVTSSLVQAESSRNVVDSELRRDRIPSQSSPLTQMDVYDELSSSKDAVVPELNENECDIFEMDD